MPNLEIGNQGKRKMTEKRMLYSQFELLSLSCRNKGRSVRPAEGQPADHLPKLSNCYSQIREAIDILLTAEKDFEYNVRDFGSSRVRVLAHISRAIAELRQASEIDPQMTLAA